ncbi:Pre-mRNA-splicing factor of RES complex-domain-containing protein [Calycina marina]|uniref:Pre-mRNA-splicing factor of RES complex-domain-containing protein n=1 Tax=Calycina marina TaxID=1763456 RepID=A0A9P7YW90_9HELO|nr:Pre-mRNA-splicing factor of RES complex-domain-containing protein [Calycina marina]
MSLQSYIAANYLTADKSSKKRKRKSEKAADAGLTIADDDALGWTNDSPLHEDDNRPTTLSSSSAEFRKSKKNAWKVIGAPALQQHIDEDVAADRIIAQAAEDARGKDDDDEPVIDETGIVKMADGTHAGLQTGKDVQRQMESRKRAEAVAWENEAKKIKGGSETVYRDATGRRIDISMRRAEAAAELAAKAAVEAAAAEEQKGDAQVAAKAKRREELEEARFMPVARGFDDKELNDELKDRDRWNDPAEQFLATKKEGKSRSGKPLYKGAAPPNRYGIRPGHRWDGVDRGNGWEGERFKAMNRVARNKNLDYSWQTDV